MGVNLAYDIITPEIRISTAIIALNTTEMPYNQYETWCFSGDIRQRSFQVIHGTRFTFDDKLKSKSIKVHGYIVANLKSKFKE